MYFQKYLCHLKNIEKMLYLEKFLLPLKSTIVYLKTVTVYSRKLLKHVFWKIHHVFEKYPTCIKTMFYVCPTNEHCLSKKVDMC